MMLQTTVPTTQAGEFNPFKRISQTNPFQAQAQIQPQAQPAPVLSQYTGPGAPLANQYTGNMPALANQYTGNVPLANQYTGPAVLPQTTGPSSLIDLGSSQQGMRQVSGTNPFRM